MKHLSALDALFFHLETPDTPMHVGSVMILEKPRAGRRDAYQRIREHIAGRLQLAPVFTRKLAPMPLDVVTPAWIRESEVDLDYHVRHLTLRKPGSRAQLEAAVEKLHEGPLDRSRPLWQFTVIDGLAGGEVAIYAKIHHGALDGQGGVAVAQALLDVTRRPRRVDAAAAKTRTPPSALRLLRSAFSHTISQYGRIVSSLPATLQAAARGVAVFAKPGSAANLLGPATPLNAPIGAKRSFVTVRIPLDEAKAIARYFGVKLNDVVLATCAGALRGQFARVPGALEKPMIGAVPASLREAGETRANAVTMMRVGLATDLARPLERLNAIAAASTRAKAITSGMKDAIPTDLPSLGLPWLMAAVMPLYRKAASADLVPVLANVIISNVPGPPVPLYFAGARLNAYFPVSIVTHGFGLNITILSYDGSLDYGLLAARDAMPGLRTFARRLRHAHEELLALVRRGP